LFPNFQVNTNKTVIFLDLYNGGMKPLDNYDRNDLKIFWTADRKRSTKVTTSLQYFCLIYSVFLCLWIKILFLISFKQHCFNRIVNYKIHNGIFNKVRNRYLFLTGCPNKHGNSVTNWISSLLWISIKIPNFKSHDIIMSTRVILWNRLQRSAYNVFAKWTVYCNFFALLSTTVCSRNINKQIVNIAAKILQNTAFSEGITILNQSII